VQSELQRAARHRILVIDDNRDAAASLAALLALKGNETRSAYDGAEGLQAAADFRPDIVLLDIGMPGLDGIETGRRIRAQPWGKDIVLIALSGWGQERDKRQSVDAGFNHHLVKPVDMHELEILLDSRRRRLRCCSPYAAFMRLRERPAPYRNRARGAQSLRANALPCNRLQDRAGLLQDAGAAASARRDGVLRREAARDGAPAPRATQIQPIQMRNLAIGSVVTMAGVKSVAASPAATAPAESA
jgi:DNA-binding response OmpR family regulator